MSDAIDYGTPVHFVTSADEGRLGTVRHPDATRFTDKTVGHGDEGVYFQPLDMESSGEAWHLIRVTVDGDVLYVPAHESQFEQVPA